MKTRNVFGIALLITLTGALGVDVGLDVTGTTLLAIGIISLVAAPLIAGAINTNNGDGF